MLKERLNTQPINLCDSKLSKHICYKNSNSNINHLFQTKNGVFCEINNIILDPSKWRKENPEEQKTNKGAPILSEGFYNAKCDNIGTIGEYGHRYKQYFNAWNYNYNNNENLEELAPGKIIFFMSRNADSNNLFHGGSELMNVISLMKILKIEPEKVKIIFLEGFIMKNDNFFDLYKNIVSRGGEPVHISTLTKKYHISSAIHVPIDWDSPCFIFSSVPKCIQSTESYQYLNNLIDKYININFTDPFISNNETYYYPKSVIDNHLSNNIFVKSITIQWRKVWPKNRKTQGRLMGNGPELADKLSSILPKNYLIRLVDTANLPILEQISLARKSDYFIGIHGAGLFLTVFTPSHCINHEILSRPNMNGLILMSSLSGHITYSHILSAENKIIDGKSYIFLNLDNFAEKIINKMKRHNFF